MSEKQRTIKNASITFKGKGLHTGVNVEMTFKPAQDNFGIRFKRIDIEGTPEEMTVGNTVLRIAAKPELVPNRSDWKGNAGKAPVGYVMPKPAGELKDSEPIKQYNPVYETPPK